MRTIVRPYDDERVAILPSNGLPPQFATWMEGFFKKRNYTDFKIVQTQDQFQTLGIVCKPKTWLRLIKYFRSQGELYAESYEQDFLEHCNNVMKGGTETLFRPKETKVEQEVKKILTEEVHKLDEEEKKNGPKDGGKLWEEQK